MYIDIKQLKKNIKPNTEKLKINMEGHDYQIFISRQITGFGEKCFMICPDCGERFTKLYFINEKLKCRNCGNVKAYWAIQNTTKGGYIEIQYRMEIIAQKNNISFEYPFDYMKIIIDERMRKPKLVETIKILQALENMRNQNIFSNTVYSTKSIKSVINGEHPNLKKYSLMEIRNYFFPW